MSQAVSIIVAAIILVAMPALEAQLTMANGSGAGNIVSGGSRTFVTGVTPVIGRNGVVGGIAIDSTGLVRAAETDVTDSLRRTREAA